MDWCTGLIGSAIIAGAAFWKKALTLDGSIAAIAVGTLVYALGTPAWYGTLIAFFVSSTLLSRWRKKEKSAVETKYAKTGKRDAGQVLANGGAATLACVLSAAFPHPAILMFYVGAIAAVNADTWATEIGPLSRRSPRSILTGQPVERGTSGGITAAGVLASATGSVFIASVALLLGGKEMLTEIHLSSSLMYASVAFIFIGLVAGVAGSLADSLLGASLQAVYRCPVCHRNVEHSEHCGKPGQLIRGLKRMNNDVVNFIASLVGGMVGVMFYALLLYA
jgi:uncharacterized protein (TIGR00297 family)